jgi:anti-sigma factor RsiW
MTMHEEWTDQLSDYLDDELQEGERAAVEAHLQECAPCTTVLNDLKRVVALGHAAANAARPPQTDLWSGVASRGRGLGRTLTGPVPTRQPRRVSFTMTELAAAAVLLIGVSAGVSWRLHPSLAGRLEGLRDDSASANRDRGASMGADSSAGSSADLQVRPDDVRAAPVSLADDQYDAAVADLEKALKQGRGKLDASTIAIVEQNLQTIDQAIAQAREALAADPANSYLSGHLFEARRRKLDLLRRATALTDMD